MHQETARSHIEIVCKLFGSLSSTYLHETISSSNGISINIDHNLTSLLVNTEVLPSTVTTFVTKDSLEQSVSLRINNYQVTILVANAIDTKE